MQKNEDAARNECARDSIHYRLEGTIRDLFINTKRSQSSMFTEDLRRSVDGKERSLTKREAQSALREVVFSRLPVQSPVEPRVDRIVKNRALPKCVFLGKFPCLTTNCFDLNRLEGNHECSLYGFTTAEKCSMKAKHFSPLGDVRSVQETDRGLLLEVGDEKFRSTWSSGSSTSEDLASRSFRRESDLRRELSDAGVIGVSHHRPPRCRHARDRSFEAGDPQGAVRAGCLSARWFGHLRRRSHRRRAELGLPAAQRRVHRQPTHRGARRHLRPRPEDGPFRSSRSQVHPLEHRHPHARCAAEKLAPRPTSRSRARARSSTPTTRRSRSFTTAVPTTAGPDGGLLHRQRVQGQLRVRGRISTAIFGGGQYTEYVFAGPRCRRSSTPTPSSPGEWAPADLGPRASSVPLYTYDSDGFLPSAGISRAQHSLRRALARHRLHGRLPRVHLGPRDTRCPGMLEALKEPGSSGHDRRSRREGRAGLPGVRRGSRSNLLCKTDRVSSISGRCGRAAPRFPISSSPRPAPGGAR